LLFRRSPLVQGRGLKLGRGGVGGWRFMSPLVQGRGLKLKVEVIDDRQKLVAPRAGAWIETGGGKMTDIDAMSPLVQGRGLKPMTNVVTT